MRILILGAGSIGITGILLSALHRVGVEAVVHEDVTQVESHHDATDDGRARKVVIVDDLRRGTGLFTEDFILRSACVLPAVEHCEPPTERLVDALPDSRCNPSYTPNHHAAVCHRTVKDSVWDGGLVPLKPHRTLLTAQINVAEYAIRPPKTFGRDVLRCNA